MCQSSNSNLTQCITNNDWLIQTANTGIATISSANSSLDGSNTVTIFTANGSNGSIVKSITIKALQAVNNGMIRLFVNNPTTGAISLYKEIPITTTPYLPITTLPTPILQTFEIKLIGGLKLANGNLLKACTQNAESYNIITEGLDYAYPPSIPSNCCNFLKETAVNGIGVINTANTSLTTSNVAPIFTAPANKGTLIKTITIKAMQSTNEGMLRFFISPDGIHFSLLQ